MKNKILNFCKKHKTAIDLFFCLMECFCYLLVCLLFLVRFSLIDARISALEHQQEQEQETINTPSERVMPKTFISPYSYILTTESDCDTEIRYNGNNQGDFTEYFNSRDVAPSEPVIYYTIYYYEGAYIYNDDSLTSFDRLVLTFATDSDYESGFYSLTALRFYDTNVSTTNPNYYISISSSFERVTFYGAIKSFIKPSYLVENKVNGVYEYYFKHTFSQENSTTLTLGLENWLPTNYLTLANCPNNIIYKNGGANIYMTKTIDSDFSSNGKVYDQILLVFNSCNLWSDNNGNVTDLGNTNKYQTLDSIYYRIKGTNNSAYHTQITLAFGQNNLPIGLNVQGAYDLVCKSQVLQYETKSLILDVSSEPINYMIKVYLPLAPLVWVSDAFKEVTFLNTSLESVPFPLTTESDMSDPYTAKTLKDIILLGYNTSNLSQYTDNGVTNVGNVFTLVGGAFTGLLPLFNVTIVPGITIGLMLFAPLVLGVVLLVVRLIKK